jgi:hypothetical protein
MKKVTFTVTQILFLHKVRQSISYSRDNIFDLLDENEDPKADVEFELSEEDIEDIADSIQGHIELEEIPDEDLATANEILVLLGLLPEETVAEEVTDQPESDADASYVNQD